jgi:bacteriorhodopsin
VDLHAQDQAFLAKWNHEAASTKAEEVASNWWWTVFFLLFVIAFLTYATMMIVKGYRIRKEYMRSGYR